MCLALCDVQGKEIATIKSASADMGLKVLTANRTFEIAANVICHLYLRRAIKNAATLVFLTSQANAVKAQTARYSSMLPETAAMTDHSMDVVTAGETTHNLQMLLEAAARYSTFATFTAACKAWQCILGAGCLWNLLFQRLC